MSEQNLRYAKRLMDRENPRATAEVDGNLGILLASTNRKDEGCGLIEHAIGTAHSFEQKELAAALSDAAKTLCP